MPPETTAVRGAHASDETAHRDLEAGLDRLQAPVEQRPSRLRVLWSSVLPPIVFLALSTLNL